MKSEPVRPLCCGRSILHLILGVALSAIGCGMHDNSGAPEASLFFLVAGTSLDGDLESLDASFGGGDYGGQVGIVINGIPVSYRKGGGAIVSINEWLIAGKNEIHLEGQHTERLFLKVLRADRKEYETTGKFQELLAATAVLPGAKADPLIFSVELPWKSVSLDQLKTDASSREESEKEIGKIVETLRSGMSNKRDCDWTGCLLAGLQENGGAYGGVSDSALKNIKSELIEKYGNATVPQETPNALHLLWGSRGVLVYADVDRFGRPFSIHLEQKNRQVYVPALVFVRKSGEWKIWSHPRP